MRDEAHAQFIYHTLAYISLKKMQQFLFFLFSVIVIVSAILVVTTSNLFHAALFLILSFFGVAGYYVLLDAGFFAVAQVLVYIGAISILIIFAVMLTRGMQDMLQPQQPSDGRLVACGLLFVVHVLCASARASSIEFVAHSGYFCHGAMCAS